MSKYPTRNEKVRTILLTGASSGIGYQASIRLLKSGNKLILPCRDASTAKETKAKLVSLTGSESVSTIVCDLADLKSIETMAYNLKNSENNIDTIALNAGLQYTGSKKVLRSVQGFELTIAVNHLANQAIVELLLPLLLKSANPRVVITSSEVHDPTSAGGSIGQPAGLGGLAGIKSDKNFEMIDGTSAFNADKAYKDSKLCNILFARQLSKKLNEIGNEMPVIVWAPGLVIPPVKKSFFRYSRQYNELGQRIFGFIARDILRITENVGRAGDILKKICIRPEFNQAGFSFYSNKLIAPGRYRLVESSTSAEAKDLEVSCKLWLYSSKLLELQKGWDSYII